MADLACCVCRCSPTPPPEELTDKGQHRGSTSGNNDNNDGGPLDVVERLPSQEHRNCNPPQWPCKGEEEKEEEGGSMYLDGELSGLQAPAAKT